MRPFRVIVLNEQKNKEFESASVDAPKEKVFELFHSCSLVMDREALSTLRVFLGWLLCPISADTSSLEEPKYLKTRQMLPK